MKALCPLIPLLALSCSLHAAEHLEQKPGAMAPPWELYDTDEDGYISFKEAVAQRMPKQVFESLDIDRDGRLNKEEFAKMPPVPID